jgi:hypothetical protein
MNAIEKKIMSNKYQSFDALDDDFNSLFHYIEVSYFHSTNVFICYIVVSFLASDRL